MLEPVIRDNSEIINAYLRMDSEKQAAFIVLMEAMVSQCAVRQAAVLFLDICGISNSAILADKILNDAEGVA